MSTVSTGALELELVKVEMLKLNEISLMETSLHFSGSEKIR